MEVDHKEVVDRKEAVGHMVVVDRKVVENFGHMEAFVDHKEVVDCIDFVEADYMEAVDYKDLEVEILEVVADLEEADSRNIDFLGIEDFRPVHQDQGFGRGVERTDPTDDEASVGSDVHAAHMRPDIVFETLVGHLLGFFHVNVVHADGFVCYIAVTVDLGIVGCRQVFGPAAAGGQQDEDQEGENVFHYQVTLSE